MESGNESASTKGFLISVSPSSDVFQNNILAPLRSAYLYEESEQYFNYKSAVLIKNPALEEKYFGFRAKRAAEGYSEEDLKESYGFLLFDDVSQAQALGDTGVGTGNSTCSTLGDPSKGIHLSMYSDCVDQNRWYNGKCGYIVIIKLTKGRVKEVFENYTQNFTTPTEGFDCHVSQELFSVSAKTSSFLAFERTQYYMYELLLDGSKRTAQSPSAAYPFAIVSFSYMDTKATLLAPQVKSEDKKLVFHYHPWRGQLQIGSQFFEVSLTSTSRASIPAVLPAVVKVDRVISMLDLRRLLPRAVFETCFSGEVFLDGLYCSLWELISSAVEQNSSLSMLLWEIKKNDVGLTFPLNDGGFLILLHPSHFRTFNDTESSASEVLQVLFVFPDSRVILRDTTRGQKKSTLPSEILKVLPLLSYAEGEVEKIHNDTSEIRCDVYLQHMQYYATLISPGLTLSPSADLSIFPEEYDVPDTHKHLYTSPEWNDGAWKNFRSYLSKPLSFQLPASKASEILVTDNGERIEDVDDDVYFCLSSLEELPDNPVNHVSEDQLTVQKSVVRSVDRCTNGGGAQDYSKTVPEIVASDDLQCRDVTKDSEKLDQILTGGIQTKDVLAPSTSDDHPAELILSITSAEQSSTDTSLSLISTESVKNCNDFQISVWNKNDYESLKLTNPTKRKQGKIQKEHFKSQKHVPKTCIETPTLQTGKILVKDNSLKISVDDKVRDPSSLHNLGHSSYRPTHLPKMQRRKGKFGKLFRDPKLRSATFCPVVADKTKSGPGQQSLENKILMAPPVCPVISECGRVLTPYGSSITADEIKYLIKLKGQSGKDDVCNEKILFDTSVNSYDTVKIGHESSAAPETTMDKESMTVCHGLLTKSQEALRHSCLNASETTVDKESSTAPETTVDKDTSIAAETVDKESSAAAETAADEESSAAVSTAAGEESSAAAETAADEESSAFAETAADEESSAAAETAADEECSAAAETAAGEECSAAAETAADEESSAAAETTTDEESSAAAETTTDKESSAAAETTTDEESSAAAETTMDKECSKAPETTVDKESSTAAETVDKESSAAETAVDEESSAAETAVDEESGAAAGTAADEDYTVAEERAMSKEFSTAPETMVDKTEAILRGGRNQSPNTNVSQVKPLRPSVVGSDSPTNQENNYSSKNNGGNTLPFKTIQENHTGTPSPQRCAKKSELLLNKLKSVLRCVKRKAGNVSKEMTDDGKDAEPCQKKGRNQSPSAMFHYNDVCREDTNLGLEVSKISVDPHFAFALGLTPKEKPDNKTLKPEDRNTQRRTDLSETQDQTDLRSSLSISPRRRRIKTLRKHQSISAECVKQKWWLHFQTPACQETEKLPYKDCIKDSSIKKTAKKQSNNAGQPTDALNLLADLALSANNEQVSPQPHPVLEKKTETSFKKCDVTKDITIVEQVTSVLHALRSQPSAVPIQPVESLSSSQLSGHSEVAGLIFQEHAYSLPPSYYLLSNLSSTPMPVSPLSGPTRLLHHQQTKEDSEIRTSQPSSDQEDGPEHDHRTPVCVKKQHVSRETFCHSRTFVNMDGYESVQVTKKWEENYDFNQDSRFMSDPKYKGIIRGLHGPWDFSIQDTVEESQLIIHIWKGLFYSQSTARFFHIDSQYPNTSSEEWDSLDVSCGMVSSTAESGHKTNSCAPSLNETALSETLISKALDLRKKKDSILDPGTVILDLSLRNSNADIVTADPQVNQEQTSVFEQEEISETLATLNSTLGPQKCYRNVMHGTNIANDVNEVRSTHDSKGAAVPSQQAGHIDVPSLKIGGTRISVQEDMKTTPIKLQHYQNAQQTAQVLHVCKTEETSTRHCIEDSEAKEMYLVQKQAKDSFKTKMDEEEKSSKKTHEAHKSEHREIESKLVGNWELKEKSFQAGNSEFPQEMILTNKRSDVHQLCNGNILEKEKLLSWERLKALSTDKADNQNDGLNFCGVQKDQVIEDDPLGKGDKLDNNSISNVEGDHSLNIQSTNPPMICDVSDSSKMDFFPNCQHHKQVEEELPRSGKKEDGCLDLQFCTLYANARAFKDEHSFSGVPYMLSEKKTVGSKPTTEENTRERILTPDLCDQQLPLSDFPNSIKDSIKECNKQAPLDERLLPTKNKEACHDLQMRKPCADGGALTVEHAITSDSPFDTADVNTSYNGPVVEENYICLEDKAHYPEVKPISYESNLSLECSSAHGSIPQTNYSVEAESKNETITTAYPNKHVHECQDTRSGEGEQDYVRSGQKEQLHGQSYSCRLFEAVTSHEDEFASLKEDLKSGKTSGTLKNLRSIGVIPFIGIETPLKSSVQPQNSHSESTLEEDQVQEVKSIVSESTHPETVLLTEVSNISQIEQSADKTVGETCQPGLSRSEVDNLCLTPTMDRKPYPHTIRLGPLSNFKKGTQNLLDSSTLMEDGMSPDQTPVCTITSDPKPHSGLNLEPKPQRLLNSISSFLSKDSHPNKSSLAKTTDIEKYLDQTYNLQEMSTGQDLYNVHSPIPECLQSFKQNIDQDGHDLLSQTDLPCKPIAYNQRPIMIVKPSKSDEIQADCISVERENENVSRNVSKKSPKVSDTAPPSMLLEKRKEHVKASSAKVPKGVKQDAREISPKSSWLPNDSDTKSYSDKAILVQNPQYEGGHIQKFNRIPSPPLLMHSSKTSLKVTDGNQSFLTNDLIEKVRKTDKNSIDKAGKDYSHASTSYSNCNGDSKIDDHLFLEPQTVTRTILNTSPKGSDSFLEQLSKRCLPDELTQTSMEQECLIFSEQMKQLLKRSKRGKPLNHLDTHDKLNRFSSSLHSDNLEEQHDSVDNLDFQTLLGSKIKVDMTNRKALVDIREEKNNFPQRISEGTSNPEEHAQPSDVTAECDCLYTAMMNDVCAVKMVPSKDFIMDKGYKKTELSDRFALSVQTKREMDEIVGSNMDSIRTKTFQVKYRFFILETSDEPFFEETKVKLQAEGHSAVLPHEFFLGEDRSSPLLIILRNIDIAHHLFEVPDLLKLKESPHVKFAGIDEPDDVVNLTQQDLLISGGFIMVDSATLESLSLSSLRKLSDILRYLKTMGKWKWMLHYKDSRRLKENARMTAEAKEKNHFVNWCQEVDLLEVLPYHECDIMSKDQLDYLTCLVHLQIQNISARYPVFITDTTESSFGKNGIFTIAFSSFLTCYSNKTFTA